MVRSFVSTSLLLLGLLVTSTAAASGRQPVEVSGVVNLNAATEAQLRLLPGVGPKKAQRIEEARTRHKFESTEQLMKVKGFGRLTYRKLKAHLSVSGPTTLVRPPKAVPPARTTTDGARPEEVKPLN